LTIWAAAVRNIIASGAKQSRNPAGLLHGVFLAVSNDGVAGEENP
jgi:hypothetical protein